jgi:cyclohexanecarboxylate-CoA ligase
MQLLVAQAQNPLEGEIVIPPSKYHAHRALILAALAPGVSTIVDRTTARHVGFTVSALRSLGVKIAPVGNGWSVSGRGLSPISDEVSVGSSGTTLYFLLGLASLGDRPVRFVGQRYFRRRPIGPLLRALKRMGVRLEATDGQSLPVTVYPGVPTGGEIRIDGTLSQWISGLLLLAPFAQEPTRITVRGDLNERPYLELTLEMMRQFGLEVAVREDWRQFEIPPCQRPTATDIVLPPDIGSAVFGLAACALHPSKVVFRSSVRIDDHPERSVLDSLQAAGVPMRFSSDLLSISMDHDGVPPEGGPLDCRDIPDMVPILSTLAVRARGRSVLGHVAHVRLKESDRVASMLQLRKMGARVEFDGNDMIFEGVDQLHGAKLSSFNDHRVLMSLAIAGSTATGVTELSYPYAFRISYPEFLTHMNAIGVPAAVTPRVPSSVQAPG